MQRNRKNSKNTVAVNLELLRGLLVGPELVRGHGERDEVEQRRDPAVERGLLVARVQGRQPLRRGLTLAWQKYFLSKYFSSILSLALQDSQPRSEHQLCTFLDHCHHACH